MLLKLKSSIAAIFLLTRQKILLLITRFVHGHVHHDFAYCNRQIKFSVLSTSFTFAIQIFFQKLSGSFLSTQPSICREDLCPRSSLSLFRTLYYQHCINSFAVLGITHLTLNIVRNSCHRCAITGQCTKR